MTEDIARMRASETGSVSLTPIGRRTAVALLLSAAVLPTVAMSDGRFLSNRHVLPKGQGDRTGLDWANATPLDQLTTQSHTAEPGQSYKIGFPEVDLPQKWHGTQVQWQGIGTQKQPIELNLGRFSEPNGMVLPDTYTEPPCLTMTGNETGPEERPDVGGDPFIVFGHGASHLRVAGPVYHRSGGNGFFNINSEELVRNIHFSEIHARCAGRVIETESGTNIEGLMVENCSALGLIRGFARFRGLTNAEFRDLDLDADFLDGGGGKVCQIISVTSGSNLRFHNVQLAKAVNTLGAMERGSRYIQGDGLVLEEDTAQVYIEDCHASDMGDGGFDLKSDGVHLINCTATRCKLGIRIWSPNPENLIESCRITEPVTRPANHGACLWVAGRVTVRDSEIIARESMPAVRFGAGFDSNTPARIRFEGGLIELEHGVSLAKGTAGHIELVDTQVNGEVVNGRFYWTGQQMEAH